MESLVADVQNIVVEGRSSNTHILQCTSLVQLPARTIYMYVDLHGSTRELIFSLQNPSTSEGEEDDNYSSSGSSSGAVSTSIHDSSQPTPTNAAGKCQFIL